MGNKRIFEKYERRMIIEGWINSFICALICALFATAIVELVLWLTGEKNSLYVVLTVVGALIICAPIFYFLKFRPDKKTVARRLDAAGLEERIITATEFAAEDSYIAKIQREDAEKKLSEFTKAKGKLSYRFCGGGKGGIAAAVSLGAAATAFVCMTLIFALSVSGILPSGKDVINGPTDADKVVVSYLEEDGGIIEGESVQIIDKGGTTAQVTAVPDDGWVFSQWSDGYVDPVRSDINVTSDLTVFAIFEEAEGEEGEGEGEGPSDAEPEEPSQDAEQDPNPPHETEDWQNNTVLDGETKYKDVYEKYAELIKEYLASGENIPEELRIFLETYNALLS